MRDEYDWRDQDNCAMEIDRELLRKLACFLRPGLLSDEVETWLWSSWITGGWINGRHRNLKTVINWLETQLEIRATVLRRVM